MKLTLQLGFWSASATTAIGGVYFVVMSAVALSGGLTLPPSEPVQLFGGVSTMLLAPLLLILAACVRRMVPSDRIVFGDLGLLGVVLFVAMVTINRFVQLTVIMQAQAIDGADDLARFLPYDPGSVMFALELLGWGWFLGLAAFAFALVFRGGRLEGAIRWSLVIYGVLALTSALGYVASSPIAAIGFVAWGAVLYVVTGLLAIWFRRSLRPVALKTASSA